ncbi:HupE/UreJ family protein [Azospirillum halopraeferens]|uniref:HupE/UreJ family protein n=1 Tax=Azospirillum halopraeferens TaxID=34010 RepID=UPI00040FF89C|nr:HupE/UreJ family protein [Azospirillum halopraeferens]
MLALPLLAAAPAEARTVLSGTAFGAGFVGPMVVPAHLLGFLGIGLWAGQNGGAAVWQVPAATLVAALAAGVAAQAGVRLPYAGEGQAGALVVIGALVAFALRVPLAVAVLTGAAAAAFHGYGYGPGGPAAAWAGFAGAVLLLTAAGVGLVALLWQAASARAVQMCGVAVAVVGVLDLAGVL